MDWRGNNEHDRKRVADETAWRCYSALAADIRRSQAWSREHTVSCGAERAIGRFRLGAAESAACRGSSGRSASAGLPASPSRASPSQNVSHWQQALVARLDRFKRYPAQAHGAEGVASLTFTIDRKGNVLNSQIATTSGSAVLDAEVLALVKRAAPFPPPPAVVVDADLSFVVPIHFTAGERR
jgi:TonB family protein